jgi:hypothetical protein
MGQLIDGVWKTDWYQPDQKGAFKRPDTQFRKWITSDADAGRADDGFVAEPGRYHLYASYACPWAQRALITRAVRGLEGVVGVTIVDAKMGDDGWSFGGEDGEKDPLFDSAYLREIYLRASPKYTGRVTVPVLWDKKTNGHRAKRSPMGCNASLSSLRSRRTGRSELRPRSSCASKPEARTAAWASSARSVVTRNTRWTPPQASG